MQKGLKEEGLENSDREKESEREKWGGRWYRDKVRKREREVSEKRENERVSK